MAGHSKWANIQHRKKAQDAKRGKIFTKMIREISVAARAGDADPDSNPRLRLAVDRALAVNMPKERIDRAIAKAHGTEERVDYEELRYEGYGPGGAAVMLDCMTDNRNRTASEVRHAFSKHQGKLGTDGCVAFMFQHKGVITLPPGTDEEHATEAALEAEAEDAIGNEDGTIEVLTDPAAFRDALNALRANGLEPAEAEVTMRPETSVTVTDEPGRLCLALLEHLEDLDDVQRVYTNADIDAAAYAEA